ncbi:hypothetical protein VPNG_08585 [Cytospora leucostoma]|uniref:Uncharacterized protein n=1 Tax=Cytospora leucostoma TaxID=1230097 RepID=A0A423W493_9PEZI|nr:hypothetical protein VPNG_08585 [Cytospora leucostoma]
MDSGDGRPATTRLISEQVSHHPPITAMAIIDDEHGIRADGYARVEMTFNGNVDIRQIGHAILHIDKFDEDYLIPLPDIKVRGFLSGRLYPEVLGTYTMVSSSGYVSEMTFSGVGVFRGKKNSFEAKMYRKGDPKKTPIYEVAGVWSEGWTVKDSRTGEIIEKYTVDAVENRPAPINIDPIEKQDPWESRRAWAGVIDAINRGDTQDIIAEKSKLEKAQRRMRATEKKDGQSWEPLLFTRGDRHEIFHKLVEGTNWRLNEEKTGGVWRGRIQLYNMAHRIVRIGLLAFITALLICYRSSILSWSPWGWRFDDPTFRAVGLPTPQDQQTGPESSPASTKWATSPAEAVYSSDSKDGESSRVILPPGDGISPPVPGSEGSTPPSNGGFNEAKYEFQQDLLLYTQPVFDVAKLRQYKPHNDHGPGQPAFATYLSTRDNSVHDPYFLSAMQLVYRVLWDPRSRSQRHPAVVFVAPFIPQEQRDLLRAAGAAVRELDLLDFSRIAFLDLDAFPVRNLDEIFSESVAPRQRCDAELLAPEDRAHEREICDYVFAGHSYGDGINVGVMVLEPNRYMHQRLLRESQDTSKFDNRMAEQAFLNYAFGQDGPFPTRLIGREWNGFFPQADEEGLLRVVHEKLWVPAQLPDWTKDIFRTGWFEMLTLYQSAQFEAMRADDALLQ